MKHSKSFKIAITAFICLALSVTVHAATLGELADTFSANRQADAEQAEFEPLLRQGSSSEPRFLESNGDVRSQRLRRSDRRRYRDIPPPWMLHEGSRPTDRLISWAYGQSTSGDDPYTWRYLDNDDVSIRWGNPLAPWSSAQMWNWWRKRAHVPGGFSPVSVW